MRAASQNLRGCGWLQGCKSCTSYFIFQILLMTSPPLAPWDRVCVAFVLPKARGNTLQNARRGEKHNIIHPHSVGIFYSTRKVAARGTGGQASPPFPLCPVSLYVLATLYKHRGGKKHSRRRTTSHQYFGPAVSRKPRTGGRAIGAATARSCIHFFYINYYDVYIFLK